MTNCPEKGAAPACSGNLGAGFELIAKMSTDSAGRAALSDAFGLCPDAQVLDETDADGYRLQMWVLLAFDDYAMGNYPFASTYLEVGNCNFTRQIHDYNITI